MDFERCTLCREREEVGREAGLVLKELDFYDVIPGRSNLPILQGRFNEALVRLRERGMLEEPHGGSSP